MYQHHDIPSMQQRAENIDDDLIMTTGDFYRIGVEVYVGTFADISGPTFVIDPMDIKGIEIFRSFCHKLAAHYKSLECQPINS